MNMAPKLSIWLPSQNQGPTLDCIIAALTYGETSYLFPTMFLPTNMKTSRPTLFESYETKSYIENDNRSFFKILLLISFGVRMLVLQVIFMEAENRNKGKINK